MNSSIVFDWSPVQVALMDLGSCCIGSPWNDGGTSNLRVILAQTARAFDSSKDFTVSIAAKTAMQLCDAACVPRAPALLFVSRLSLAPDHQRQERNNQAATAIQPTTRSAEDVVNDMRAARTEIERAAKFTKEVETAKRRKLEDKWIKEQRVKEAKDKKIRKAIENTSKVSVPLAMDVDDHQAQSTATEEKHQNQKDMKGDVEKASTEDSSKPVSAGNPPESEQSIEDEGMKYGKNMKEDYQKHNKPVLGNAVERESGKLLNRSEEEVDDEDDDEEFPNIVEGGPDSDDE